jgi:gluconolactonase
MKTPITFVILIFMIIPFAQAQPELLLDGFSFTEGPAVDSDGKLYFSDIPDNRIYVYSEDKLDVFLENSGGANGLYFDKEGNLIACAGKARQLISVSPDANITILADEFDGKKLNSPNDLWIDPSGGIYFTDPRYGNSDNLEQDGMHVYYLGPEKDELIRVTEKLVRPNGIIGTPDGKILYVVDQGVEKTYRYKIKKNGELSGQKLFAEFGTDGMSMDDKGNLYITNGKNIELYNPGGNPIQSFEFPSYTTNVVWTPSAVYITTQAGQVFVLRNKSGETD